MSKYLMGIDNGGTAIKVGIYDLEGNEVATSGTNTEVITPSPGRYERDMNEIWNANIEAITNVLKESNIKGEQIAGIAVTGHGNGLYMIDNEGNPTYNAIQSSDSRAVDIVEKWNNDGTFDKVHPKTLQSLWPASTIALLAWMKDNKPEVINKTKSVFFAKDYVRYKLTGEVYVEITDLSGSNILNNIEKEYDIELLNDFGIGDLIDIMPPIKNSADICGYITKDVSRLTGLKEGTPVAGGMFDIDAAGIATGINDESKMNVIVGTWANNQYISSKPVITKDIFMTSLYSIPGYWLVLEGSATSASNLEWFVQNFMDEESKKAKAQGTSIYKVCDNIVENLNPTESDIVFLPFLYGSNASLKAKSAFVGLEGWNKRDHVIRAIYEGIAFSHKTHYENLLKHRNKPEVIRIAGGAGRSKVWMQMFADILETPLEIIGASELGTMGASMCAGVATGIFKDFNEAIEKMVKVIRRVEPDNSKKNIYQKKYNRYKKVISSLETFWD